ncbi:MAG TPA: tol-pal system-associated acyl-CoA thioesterase [Xanthomonadaceae bacterium]|nr:tol-pal system-associated acyl-CoA thioesterase [Xanthomonadaceae bacterium]
MIQADPFVWQVRVYWEDTDGGGVVYHAAYLKFLERARTELLRDAGLVQSRMRESLGLIFVLRGVKMRFLKPARLDDLLQVQTWIARRGRASLDFGQRILRDGELLLTAEVAAACLEADTFRPAALPTDLFRSDTHKTTTTG